MSNPELKAWKTITIGGKSADELLAELKAAFKIGDCARDMMARKEFLTERMPREVDIVTLTVSMLGYPTVATSEMIWCRAKDLGLELCPPSVGPHLRLAYGDQPLDEWLWVAMDPFVGSYGLPSVFEIRNAAGVLSLDGYVASMDDVWRSRRRLAFVLPRKGEERGSK